MAKTATQERREAIKAEVWPTEIAWTGENEKGWFRAPRSIALVMSLLAHQELTGNKNATGVYLDLLSRHRDTGVVDMVGEGEHSYSSGYVGTRGIRTWRERMQLLEELGFIKTRSAGNQDFRYVLLIHPTVAVQALKDSNRIPEKWWQLYRQNQIETKEATYEQIIERCKPKNPKKPRSKVRTNRTKAG